MDKGRVGDETRVPIGSDVDILTARQRGRALASEIRLMTGGTVGLVRCRAGGRLGRGEWTGAAGRLLAGRGRHCH